MKLKSFQVTNFRNIVDSGQVAVDSQVTALVGKNEAGKSGLIEALYLLNPAYKEVPNAADQYPKWLVVETRRKGKLEDKVFISAKFEIEEEDRAAVEGEFGKGVLTGSVLTAERNYGNTSLWGFEWSEKIAVANIVDLIPDSVSALCRKASSIEQLNSVLQGIEADDEAGRTSADVTAAREFTKPFKDGKALWKAIVEVLEPRLPKFFKFSKYNMLPGRIEINKLASKGTEQPGETPLQTARALLQLANADLVQLQNETYDLRRGELDAVQIDLSNQVFEYWKQNPNLKVNIDVDSVTENRQNGQVAVAKYIDIRLSDNRTGYSNNFEQRSSGFQWFFSFLAAFSEFEGKEATIVLLDEPALTLHGRAQADFLRFINDRLSSSSPVIYTTHSPFMVEMGKLERVRVVEDQGPPTGSTVTDEVFALDQDSIFPLQAALGYDIAQSLFIGPNNLVVEGPSDFIYLTVMSLLVGAAGKEKLDPKWRVLPAGGATNIPTFVSLLGRHMDITVLADSDAQGMQRINNMVSRELLNGTRLILANAATGSKNGDIEDLFSEADYLALYNKTFKAKLAPKQLRPGDRIVKRIEAHFGTAYDHGVVAETLLRHHQEFQFSEESLQNFGKLNALLNATIGS